jgi:hypothetical protein
MIDQTKFTVPKLTVEERQTIAVDAAKRNEGECQAVLVDIADALFDAYNRKFDAMRDVSQLKEFQRTAIESARAFKVIAAKE